ncbi:MAG: PQQ-binding-like beta-propeller repeat protein [Caldisericaceae bacterium]|nr:PQQ-binding-like beta-propeller repeat protein [Caldisericaceae bacterium]
MKVLRLLFLEVALLLLVACQSPHLGVEALSELPEQLNEGWNTERWYFVNVEIDTPFTVVREKNINGLATPALFRIADRLILTTFNGFLISTDTLLKDVDRKRFSRELSTAPAFLRPLIFIASEKGAYGLQAYDLLHKKVSWRLKGHFSKSSPLIQKDLLIHASIRNEVLALNPLNGETLWHYQFPQKILQNLAMTDRFVVVCSGDGLLAVLNADDGQQNFMIELPEHVYTSPLILNQAIFIADLDGNVFKIDLPSGKIINKVSLATPFYQPFSTDGQSLFIMGSNGKLFAFTPELKLKGTVPLKGVPTFPIVVTHRHLLIATYQKKFYLVDKNHLKIVQELNLKRRAVSCVPDKNSTVFLAMEYDRLLLLKAKGGRR